MRAKRTLRNLQHPRSLMDYLRQFLTPQVCKQARQAVPRGRTLPRWDLQPLLILTLAMTWAAGDSQAERFETARGFYVATHQARKRPGATVAGFQKALARVPMRQLRAVAAGVRHQIRVRFAGRLLIDGFEPMGCDGSRIECPRSAELDARLRQAGKDDAAPTIWVTAFVHLATGLLWSWQLGPGQLVAHVGRVGDDQRRRRGLHGLRAGRGHRADEAIVPAADVVARPSLHPRARHADDLE